ncbi:hypothetical protein DFS33DRAFT_779591 [Desarmillaria ectypa]|nr:hypothetical protein DFS33DRAFT_779591 [Desarmillaria ectypa]
MFKCRQLSKLPKLNGNQSVVFRGCKPGALTGAFPISDRFATRLDPKHPALRVNLKTLPIVSQPFLVIKAIPFGVLTKPENALTFERPVELWESRVARLKYPPPPTEYTDTSSISLPVHLMMPKKTVHKKKYLRVTIARKIKTAIALIFSRGLDVEGDGQLVLNDRQTRVDCDKLIVDGWSYVISPQLEIYRMPFEDLVKGLRKSLLQISSGIRQLEQQWAAKDKRVYSGREEARFTSARPGNPTLAEMRAKMRENEEKRRRDATVESEFQLDGPSPETVILEAPPNGETLSSSEPLSPDTGYSLPEINSYHHPLDQPQQHDVSSSFVSAAFNNGDDSIPARIPKQDDSLLCTNQMPKIPPQTIEDDNASTALSFKKKDNSSWISFLDDVVEDAEKDILFAPIEDEEEPGVQDDRWQKTHRYASRWDGFHTNHGSLPTQRDGSISENPVIMSCLMSTVITHTTYLSRLNALGSQDNLRFPRQRNLLLFARSSTKLGIPLLDVFPSQRKPGPPKNSVTFPIRSDKLR